MKHYIYPILLTIAIFITLPFILFGVLLMTVFFRREARPQEYWHPQLRMWVDCGPDNWDKRGYKLRSKI